MRTENTRVKETSTILHKNPEGRPEIIWLRALVHIRRIPRHFNRDGTDGLIGDFSGGSATFISPSLSSTAQKCRWETPKKMLRR